MERDESGRVKPYDDTEIPADSFLLRGVPSQHVVNGQNGRKRISSAVLNPSTTGRDPYEGLSVDVKHKLDVAGVDAVSFIKSRTLPNGSSFVGALSLKVSSFRAKNFLVGHEPLQHNEFHGAVWQNGEAKLTRKVQQDILKEAAWLIEISNTDICPQRDE